MVATCPDFRFYIAFRNLEINIPETLIIDVLGILLYL
mgnify:CR=1 FL=1|jgi:hypothetical protein